MGGGADRIERQQRQALVQRAYEKQAQGETLTRVELSALKQYEREQEERVGLAFASRVPKKLYCQWAGRQQKVVNGQHDQYGLPVDGPTIGLPAVVRWIHDFLAEHKHELAHLVKGDSGADDKTPKGQLLREQVEHYKKKNRLLAAKLEEQQGDLLPREAVHELMVRAATLLRGAGHRLQQRFGDEAGAILEQTLDDFGAVVEQFAADDDGDETEDPRAAAA